MADVKIVPTKFMMELKNKMKDSRGIADSTANTYISNLVLLNEKKVFNNLGFLKKDKDRILEYLEQYAETTETNYLSAVVSALSTVSEQHLYKTIYKFYRDSLNKKLDKLDETDTQAMTATQKKNWIEWDDVQQKWNSLKEEVNKFKGDKSLSKRNFEILLDFVVLSLYVLIPPRRNKDFMQMYVLLRPITSDEHLEPEIKNYLDLENQKFMFNVYKTQKYYGQQIEDIPDDLFEILKLWVKFHPHLNMGAGRKPREVRLFVNHDGTPYTLVNFITLRLNKIFEKKVASTMLRHIYITHKFGPEFEEMYKEAKVTASKMSHNIEQQRSYVKAKSDD